VSEPRFIVHDEYVIRDEPPCKTLTLPKALWGREAVDWPTLVGKTFVLIQHAANDFELVEQPERGDP
jgi:hypothetical protein